MQIFVVTGTGTGPTPLAAFDAALDDAGLLNYNLITLSSVIPPYSTVRRDGFVASPEEYGDRLYTVIARQEAIEFGQEAWAGLGWTQDKTGHGLFVELYAGSHAAVYEGIHATLKDMIARRPAYHYGPIQHAITGITCHEYPVCAIVIAVYQSERW